jgi:hypothetical protein
VLHCRDTLLCFLALNYHSVSQRQVTDLDSRALDLFHERGRQRLVFDARSKDSFLIYSDRYFFKKLFTGLLLIKKSKTRIGLQHLGHYQENNFLKNWKYCKIP